MDQGNQVIITLSDVYRGQTEILGKVSEVVGKIDAVTLRNSKADELHRDHETRIRSLEAWRYSIPAAGLISLASIVTAIISLFHR